MPPRAVQRRTRSSSRGRRPSTGAATENEKSVMEIPDIATEAQAVEALLAGRRSTMNHNNSPWGMWAAIVAMEVAVFVWCKWAIDIYGIYRIANP